MQMIVTGSWDKSVRYWDIRAPSTTPAGGAAVGDKIFVMDVVGNLCVVGTAARRVVIYDLRKPTVEYKNYESPLKYQFRSLACFPDMTGYAAGSIEGRVAIQYIEESGKNFVFKWYGAQALAPTQHALLTRSLVCVRAICTATDKDRTRVRSMQSTTSTSTTWARLRPRAPTAASTSGTRSSARA